MKNSLFLAAFPIRVVAALASLAFGLSEEPARADEDNLHAVQIPEGQQNMAYRWLNISQEATARDIDRVGARPPIISRAHGVWATCMYDAWVAYDEKAIGTRLGGKLRRPASERTIENKNKAISYASYRALLDLYPLEKDYLAGEMKMMGYDPGDESTDATTAQGVGNIAAKAVIEFRHHDGANQLGDEIGSTGERYSDYTYYRPVNSPDRITDPDRWQPIAFDTKEGGKETPGFLAAHWYRVKPVVIENAAQFRPGPPPTTKTDNATLKKETDQVLAYNANLTPEQKAVVEFMRDGPRSTGQSGHWLKFGQDVSKRDKHDLDRDVKLYFAIANTAMDAFISCWETKRYYDSSRPWTLVRHYYAGSKVTGWAGPNGGTREMAADEWHPYSPYSFITPPFPGYTSGHATVSGACSKILELFTGSDRLGLKALRTCCVLTEKVPGSEVKLDLPTFSATAEMAALSRAMGGYHIPIDNQVGLKVGRQIAEYSWPKYQAYFNGTAPIAEK